ncbi:MAG: glycosyltransferase family 2 protein [Eubacteriales bacterium]|nr:glycosyltransferase family 2 protein [Eubacteriales bacterium]
MNKILTIIIPCVNEEKNINIIYDEIIKINFDYNININILFIDDGSKDLSKENIRKLANKDQKVKYVFLSKNFGKEAAIFAGLEKSKELNSNYICIMDCDLQDPPSLLPKMINVLEEDINYEAVSCKRVNRKGEGVFRSFFSILFYKIMRVCTKVDIPEGARDYLMMREKFRDTLLSHREKNRFFKGLYNSIGFNIKWIEFENVHIDGRNSRWSIMQLFSYALLGIISYSEIPLTIASFTGIILFLASIIGFIFVFIRARIFGDPVAGWPSLVCILLFLFGLQYLFIGILGLYMSKNYKELKNRPIYVLDETNIK